MNLPIRVRLTLWYAVLLATIITALSAFLVLQLRTDLRQALDAAVRASSMTIVDSASDDSSEPEPGEPAEAPDAEDSAEDAQDFRDAASASLRSAGGAQVLDDRGDVLLSYGTVASPEQPMSGGGQTAAALSGRSVLTTRELGAGEQAYRVLVTPYRDKQSDRVLVVAFSLQPVEHAVRRVLVLLLIAGPAALAATALTGYLLARKAMRPVEQMTADAEAIGAGQLNDRVAVPPGGDEIRQLAVTLNAMLARIEHGVMDKHRLIADASHELRTPLAVMRAELDVSLRGDALPPAAKEVLESAREEVDRMSRTVDNLLTMAAADEGRLELLTTRLDLLAAADGAARPLRLLAAAKEVSLVVAGEPLPAQADPQRLHLALTNIIENAIKFSPPGGTVRVTTWREDAEVGVRVDDEGPGVPPADREHLFDRYYRVDDSLSHNHGGSGLGLAIARDVAGAHGGRLWVDSAKDGTGSSFALALPAWRSLGPTGQRPVGRSAPAVASPRGGADEADLSVPRVGAPGSGHD